MQYHSVPCNTMQYHAIPHSTMTYRAVPCNTMHYHAIPCNTVQYCAIPCQTMQYNAGPCNIMQYHGIPWNTMQYHASWITAVGAYHCPVGSSMVILGWSRSTMTYRAIPCNTVQYCAIPCHVGAYHCPVGSSMVIFQIWNFYIFHYTLICRFADVHGSCRAQKWNINNYRGCCVQRIFSKNRFGGQTIGTVLHMSVGPFGPGIGIYPNIWDVVYKVYYKKKDFEAK